MSKNGNRHRLARLVLEAELIRRTKQHRRHLPETTRRRKLVLIEPQAPGKHIFSKLKLPRLGVVLLATIARQEGWEAKVYVEDIAATDYTDLLTADLVGISSTTSTAERAYAIADAIGKYGVPVVMGGPHVSFLVDEALEHCDYVVRGEGEKALPALLRALTGQGDLHRTPNLSYRDAHGVIRHNPTEEAVAELDDLPYPDFELVHGWKATRNFHGRPIIPIQGTRGCPFGCKFCSVINMFGRRMRFRSAEHIVGEIARYNDPGIHLFFYDDNFVVNKGWTREILQRTFLDRRLAQSWSSQVRIEAARDEQLLSLMHRTSCTTLYIGMESINPAALREVGKQQTPEQIKQAVAAFNRAGINVHGMFVLGFDSDDRQTINETIRFAIDSGILTVQFLILTPLPGTPLFHEIESAGRLAHRNWSQYDAHHVVYRPAQVAPWELQWAQIKGMTRFYSNRRAMQRLLSGYVAGSAVYLYARRSIHQWRHANKLYLHALKRAERALDFRFKFNFDFDLSEIRRQVQLAAQRLVYA